MHDPAPLLKSLIRCASVTPAEAGVLDVLVRFLEPLGFHCTRLRFEGDNSYPVDNLFATRGTTGRHLLFAGHTDVVPPGDLAAWTYDPFAAAEAEGQIWGRGAVDMKSGLACFCTAVARAVADGSADRGTISLTITNDEEADGVNGTAKLMRWAAEQGHSFGFAIVGEPSSSERLGDSIKIGRRGSLNGRVTVTGIQGHVAYPERALNPLPVAAALVGALTSQPLDGGSDFFQASNLEVTSIDTGNETTNLIPARATMRFNIRFNDLWDEGKLEAWLKDRMASLPPHGRGIQLELLGKPSRAFISEPGGDVALLDDVIAELTGDRPELATGGGTSDARFIAPYCPVVECGLVGATMHQVDERVEIAQLEGLTALYSRFIARFFV